MLKTPTLKKKQEKENVDRSKWKLRARSPPLRRNKKKVCSAKDHTSIRHDKNHSHAGPATQV